MRAIVAVLAVLAIAVSVWQLESGRAGLTIAPLPVPGGPPATLYSRPDAGPAPVVVIAHGFAGSRQLMEPFALTLAQAGYLAVSFDFAGHGRNPEPMSGDVTAIDGTTLLLMDEAGRVADAALALPGADGRVAYVGHSMASDVVVRQALRDPRAGAVVAVSMFSQAITPDAPANLLVVAGEWEGRLVAEGGRALRLADPAATLGQTVGDPAQGTGRRAVAAPTVEHVGVLYSVTTLTETRDWLNAAFGRAEAPRVQARGGWIALLLIGVVALAWPLARALPPGPGPAPLPARVFWPAALVPALIVPPILWPAELAVLPVLVADYLAMHLALMGFLALWWLGWRGALRGLVTARALLAGVVLAVVLIAGFGGVLDRYVASFWPHPGRAAIIAALALGAVAWMVADAVLTEGGRAGWGRMLAVRLGFLASLGLAVALNPGRLLFLVIIMPVIALFFLLFGLISGWVGRRTGAPLAGGLALGLMLAWSLGVTFPLFAVQAP
jgi:dienelactone hydrolase